ncbi:MAG: hypothetical protein WKF33_05700 [Thermoleophilaceae bacterium]
MSGYATLDQEEAEAVRELFGTDVEQLVLEDAAELEAGSYDFEQPQAIGSVILSVRTVRRRC